MPRSRPTAHIDQLPFAWAAAITTTAPAVPTTNTAEAPRVRSTPRARTKPTAPARPPKMAPHAPVQRGLGLGGGDVQPLAKVMPFAPRRDAALQRAAAAAKETADAWYERACELEESDVDAAVDAYGRALTLDPLHAPTLLNVGRLHHGHGALALAEAAYRRAFDADPTWGTAAFNLGVVLEDAGKRAAAIAAYETACAAARPCVDAHFNVARLYEDTGDRQSALRHLMAYRRAVR